MPRYTHAPQLIPDAIHRFCPRVRSGITIPNQLQFPNLSRFPAPFVATASTTANLLMFTGAGQNTIANSDGYPCFDFSGTNSGASMSLTGRPYPSIPTGWSMTGWFRIRAITSGGAIFVNTLNGSYTVGLGISTGTGNHLTSYWGGSTSSETAAITGLVIPLNRWFFGAMTYDSETLTTYMNNRRFQLALPTSGLSSPLSLAGAVYLGFSVDGDSNTVSVTNMQCDDVAIVPRCLSTSEIRALATRRAFAYEIRDPRRLSSASSASGNNSAVALMMGMGF